MRVRNFFLLAGSAMSLALAGCDNGVAFPGLDERPSERNGLPLPPNVDDVNNPATPDPTPGPIDTPPPQDTPAPDDLTPTEDEPVPEPEDGEDTTPPTSDDTQSDDDPDTDPADDTDEPSPAETDTPSEEVEVADEDDDDVEDTTETTVPAPDTTETPDADPGETETETTDVPLEPTAPVETTFAYHAPGDLIPGSGQGSPDQTVYAPDMVFPIQTARTFPQSQVFRPGGFRYDGNLPGDECIPENYEYPWRDNFCERGRSSSFKTPHCPAGSGIHLGQDIRVGDGRTCEAMRRQYRTNTQSITAYRVVAAEDGVISSIGSYLVSLRAGPRTYRYLHLNMRALQVSVGDEVEAGDLLGYVSKDFGFNSDGSRRPTTFHLHFEIKVNTENGSVFVPPYTSLVDAYARRERGPGEEIQRAISIASDNSQNLSDEVFEYSE